jgi:hypothetical protein
MTDTQPETTLDEDIAELRRLTAEAAKLPTAGISSGTDLIPSASRSPEAVKTELAAQRSLAIRTAQALREQQAGLEARLARELAEVRAALAPLQAYTRKLEEAVWTVNLYLGRDEEIVTLLDGAPAPAGTPISIRQMVLSMDEETTIAAADGGIDFRDVAAFDAWISEPEHLHQVLPEPRGVVVLMPRRTGRDYGDPYISAKLNEENRRSYWLIRNGDRLFRMSTDFPVGDRLTPTREEFTSFFVQQRHDPGTGAPVSAPIKPGTAAWLRAEEAADARRRHFMRAALILQGLIDRTTVFRPLPAEHVSVLDPASYDAGHVQLITDAENALSTGRQPFYEWLTERNAQIRRGMRIVGSFKGTEFQGMRTREGHYAGEHVRLHPSRAETPPSGVMYRIEDVRSGGGGLVIRYDRTEEVWTRDSYDRSKVRKPKTRASCTLYPSDRFILPIDLVTIEEMTDYLNARTERHAYADMIPLLTAAIGAKQAEAEAERPFKALLAGQIAAAHSLDLDAAAAQVDDLVQWWKLTNVWHRPLVAGDDPETEARAVREIVTEAGARLAAAATAAAEREADAAMAAWLRECIPDAVFVGRTRKGGYVALAPQPRIHPEPPAHPQVYLRRYTTGKTGRNITESEWITVTPAQLERWRTIWASPAWDTWDLTPAAGATLTDPEIDTLLGDILTAAEPHTTTYWDDGQRISQPSGVPAVVTYQPDGPGKGILRAYLDTGTEPVIPARLLTCRLPDVEMRRIQLRWHRSTGATIRHTVSGSSSRTPWDISRLWRDDPGPHIRPPWHNETVIWTDHARVQRLQTQAETVSDAQKRARDLGNVKLHVLGCIAAAWEAQAEEAAYDRFLDDYRDPELWEGHRKTLKNLTFPHRGDRELSRLLGRLIEDGHELSGHTVATATKLLPDEEFHLPGDVQDLPLTAPDPNH